MATVAPPHHQQPPPTELAAGGVDADVGASSNLFEAASRVKHLLQQVHHELEEERQQADEWRSLECSNSSLLRSLHSSIHSTHRALALSAGASDSAREHALLLTRTTAFLATSSAWMRQQLQQTWRETKQTQAALFANVDAPATAAAAAAAPTAHAKDQRCELAWILQSLPNVSQLAPGLPLPAPPAQPSALPLHPTPSPYCTLAYPLERVSQEWKALFPLDFLTADFNTTSSDLKQWETLLEDVWDALQNNRQLWEEHQPGATKGGAGGGVGTVASPIDTTAATAVAKVESGDSVMSHAMSNFGFVTDPRLQAKMMGYSPDTAANTAAYGAYEFDEADSPQNIVMESDVGVASGGGDQPSTLAGGGSRSIKCATLNKLIERVTHEKYVDLNTRYVFLLTYHSFTTPHELLSKLSRRFHVPLPPHLSPGELQHFKAHKLDRIQIRVCSVLKNWIDEHWSDFSGEGAGHEELKGELHRLIQNMLENSGSLLTTQLAKALAALVKKKEKMYAQGTLQPQQLLAGNAGGTNPSATASTPAKPSLAHALSSMSLLSSSSSSSSKSSVDPHLDLLSCDEVELARQLTLLDFSKFRSIQPRECLNQNWSKSPALKSILAPNILAMISQFNKVSTWVQYTIVTEREERKRVKVYEKFIRIAEQCRRVNNFNSLFAIYCGLTANPVHRLKRTQSSLGSKYQKRFGDFVDLFRGEKNSRNFRRTLQMSLTPCIPHLGIFLSDLTFTEDGNPDLLAGMINFNKRCKLAERIRWIKQYQQERFDFPEVPQYQAWIQRQLQVETDPEKLWKMSVEVEPKETQQAK